MSFSILSNFYTYLLLSNQNLLMNFYLVFLLYGFLCKVLNYENLLLHSFFVSNLQLYLLFFVKNFVPVLFCLDEFSVLYHQNLIFPKFIQSHSVLMFYRWYWTFLKLFNLLMTYYFLTCRKFFIKAIMILFFPSVWNLFIETIDESLKDILKTLFY